MAEFKEPDNDIERAIAAAGTREEDDPDGSKRRKVLAALAMNPVVILLQNPLEGEELPKSAEQAMFVSDGKNTEQPMLATFTSAERALDFVRVHGGFENPCSVPGPWAIANLADTIGMRINPNQELGFRIMPDLAKQLKADIAEAMDRARERTRMQNMEP